MGHSAQFKQHSQVHRSREKREMVHRQLTESQAPLDGGEYDIYIFKAEDENPYQVWLRFGGKEALGITFDEFKAMNSHLNFSTLKGGEELRFPKGTIYKESEPSTTASGGEHDIYIFKAEDGTFYNVWLKFGGSEKLGITYDAFEKMNSHLNFTGLKGGEEIKFPKGTITPQTDVKEVSKVEDPLKKNVTYRGDLNSKKRLLVNWSIDDGPRGATTEKMKKEGMGGIPQATWFIQYNNIKTTEDWDNLRAVQASGGEVAIHSFYKDDDHCPWFPKVKGSAYGFKHIDDPMSTRMTMLEAFKEKLNLEKLYPMFVRLPGGLVSELENYATQLGQSAKSAEIAKKILAGTDVSTYVPSVQQIADDFALLKTTLNKLNLLLWGSGGDSVNVDPKAIGRQEWTQETSGATGRNDNTTKIVDPTSLTAKKGEKGGSFERLIETMKDGDVKGMVILTHDTKNDMPTEEEKKKGIVKQNDIRAVKDDREHMEKTCLEKGILLEYHTMSSLFTEVTGQDRVTYKADY